MAMVASDNEGSASEVRVTRDGRKITYKINVLQHPEKARACGQGAKSSTDRRPVDPPPILDLRIFEEDADGSEKDITFSYRANFFMWASLELARPVAAVRGSKDTQNTPVLCGSPVSGISYLDRPSPAGYFIFPDLSVRHEGRYRLCFMLYEELRDYPLDDRAQPDGTARPQAADCVNGRCIVRSRPFTVFSAKKFPGLSESTILSRTVAEQGCRVRIRRDVRMRRRDSKGVKDDYFEDDEPEEEDNRPASPEKQLPLPAEPTTDSSRTTSTGNGATYQAMHRNSASDLNAQYNGYTQPVPTPQPYAVQQYEQSGIPQYVPPQYVAQHSPAAQYPPPTYGYPQYYAYPQYAYMSQPVQPVFAQPQQPPMRHDNLNYTHSSHDFNQPPAQYGSQIQQIDNNRAVVSTGQMSMNGVQNHTHQDSPHSRSNSTYNRNSLPPIQTQPSIQSNGSYDSYSAHPTTTPHQYSAQTHQSYTSAIPEPYRTQPQPPAHYLSSTPSDAPKAKRSYASTFSTQHGDERLQGGARPDTDRPALTAGTSEYGYAPLLAPDGPAPGQNSSDDDDSETLMMEYKRADGTIMQRRWRNG